MEQIHHPSSITLLLPFIYYLSTLFVQEQSSELHTYFIGSKLHSWSTVRYRNNMTMTRLLQIERFMIVVSIFILCLIEKSDATASSLFSVREGPKTSKTSKIRLECIRGGSSQASIVLEQKKTPIQLFIDTVKESRAHLAAAAAARSVSIFGMFPVGTLRLNHSSAIIFCYTAGQDN